MQPTVQRPSPATRFDGAWLVGLPIALTLLVFWSIVRNYFFGDDLVALYDVATRPLVDLVLRPYGGHLQATRNLLYLALFEVAGPTPAVYFSLALLTHLVNVALTFAVVRQLTGSARLAAFGAALWGATPVAEGALGWFAVYGQVLVVGALGILLHRCGEVARSGRLGWGELAVWGVVLAAASTSFGLGLTLTLVMPIVAWLLLPPSPARRRAVIALGLIAVVVLAGWYGMSRVAAARYPKQVSLMPPLGSLTTWTSGLEFAALLGVFGVKSLLLGPFALRVSQNGWLAWSLGAGALAIGLVAFRAAPSSRRRQMLACALVAVASYGSIAAGRLVFYRRLGDLMVESERYQYAALLPVTFLCALVLAQLATRWRISDRLANAALAVWFVVFAGGQLATGRAIDHHDRERAHADFALYFMTEMAGRQPAGADVYFRNAIFHGVGAAVVRNPLLFPGWAGLFALHHTDGLLDGRRVRFVEADPATRAAATGLRSEALLVGPADVPPERVLSLPDTGPRTPTSVKPSA